MRLKDKVAIVTGAAHGMGEEEARLFAREGARVVVGDILEDRAEAVATDIRAGGGDAIAATIDVTSEPEWIVLIAKAVANYGRFDILVNNAGGIVNLAARGMLVVSVARRLGSESPLPAYCATHSNRAGPEKGALSPLS